MATRLAILGLDPVQREWLSAVAALRAAGEIELVGVGHRTAALAKDVADGLAAGGEVAVFDDVRLLMKEATPQVILFDRPTTAGVEFLRGCAEQGVGVLTLGPPVENVAEAWALAEVLEPRTHLLYVWPRMADAFAYRHCAQAEEFVKPIRFAAATWLGMNHAMARAGGAAGAAEGSSDAPLVVRSLSVLAWDALSTLIELLGMPTNVHAAVRGTVAATDTFSDISGAASLTLRFEEDGVASVTLCDQVAGPDGMRRDLMVLGKGGIVKLEKDAYEFRDEQGKLIDSGRTERRMASSPPHGDAARGGAEWTLREFLNHYKQPASPARGWDHRLVELAATMEALVVSHRTGQAESPERFRLLRR